MWSLLCLWLSEASWLEDQVPSLESSSSHRWCRDNYSLAQHQMVLSLFWSLSAYRTALRFCNGQSKVTLQLYSFLLQSWHGTAGVDKKHGSKRRCYWPNWLLSHLRASTEGCREPPSRPGFLVLLWAPPSFRQRLAAMHRAKNSRLLILPLNQSPEASSKAFHLSVATSPSVKLG